MNSVKMFTFNVYATNEKGENFRAVSCTECGKSVWRLCRENKFGDWDFVSERRYESGIQAISDCDSH